MARHGLLSGELRFQGDTQVAAPVARAGTGLWGHGHLTCKPGLSKAPPEGLSSLLRLSPMKAAYLRSPTTICTHQTLVLSLKFFNCVCTQIFNGLLQK